VYIVWRLRLVLWMFWMVSVLFDWIVSVLVSMSIVYERMKERFSMLWLYI